MCLYCPFLCNKLFNTNFRSRKKIFGYLCNRVVFSPDLSMKISNFSKTVHTIFMKFLHNHSTPKGAPACAMASKSYDWDVRNIAKISPKMDKIWPFFDIFRFCQKLSIRCERNFLQSSLLWSSECNFNKFV